MAARKLWFSEAVISAIAQNDRLLKNHDLLDEFCIEKSGLFRCG